MGASRWTLALALCVLGFGAGVAAPAAADNHTYEITVLVISQEPGGIDGRARRFDRILGRRLRYQSLRFLKSRRRSVALDEIGSVRVRGTKAFRFRPIDEGGKGVLVAVDWETRGDFRIHKGKPLILGGPATKGGELIVILEAR